MWRFSAPCAAPMRVVACGKFVSDVPFTHSSRRLDTNALLIGLTGTLHLTQGDGALAMSPGDALLLRPGEAHHGHAPCAAPLAYYWCHFTCPAEATYPDGEDAARAFARIRDGARELLVPAFAAYPNADQLAVLFGQLLHLTTTNPSSGAIGDYALTLLLLEMTRQSADAHGGSRAQGVLAWVRANCHRPLGVADVAARFHISADHLSVLCRRETGEGMQAFIHRCKVAKAKTLLLGTEEPVYAIAQSLGFVDEKYFMRLFKRYEGITPSAYRNAMRAARQGDR